MLKPGTLGPAQATVYLRGANVTSFKVRGVEWIGLRADCKLDGSKANISGGIVAKRLCS